MKLDPAEILRRYSEAKSLRSPLEPDWREAAQFCLPRHNAMWMSPGSVQIQPQMVDTVSRRRNFDSTAQKALPKWCGIMERILTPRTMLWHGLAASDKELMKIKHVKAYFEELTMCLFRYRYNPKARFSSIQAENYTSIGLYGTGVKFIDQRMPKPYDQAKGIQYRLVPLAAVYLLLDENDVPDTVFRRLDLTARQFEQKFSRLPKDAYPPRIAAEFKKAYPSDTARFEIVHLVAPRDDYDPSSFGSERFPFGSAYVSVEDQKMVGDPGGYRRLPYIPARYFTEPGSAYGYAPAEQALAAMGSVNAQKKTILKQGQKAVDPVLLAHDDGVVGGRVDQRPGAVNIGGVNKSGQKLIQTLDSGNFKVAEELLADERADIGEAFFTNIFQILMENPDMKATTVVELAAEKAAILAPAMGQMQSEDLGPTIEREIDVLTHMGVLPEMPPELIEAEGEYEVSYTSPLARSQKAEPVANFMRLSEFAAGVANQTGNPKVLRRLNFEAALPEIADSMAIPTGWLTSDDELEAMAAQDQQQMAVQQMADAAPAIAGMAKAAATTANNMPKGGQQ